MSYVYDYSVKINHLQIDLKCEIYFTVKGKRYAIVQDKTNGKLLLSEDGTMCKVLLFVVNENILHVMIDGECKLDHNWKLVNINTR